MKGAMMAIAIACLMIMGWPGQAEAFSQINELPDSISQMIANDSLFIYVNVTDTPKTLSLVSIQRDGFGKACSWQTQTWLCSPGRRYKPTPKGNFRIHFKLEKARSAKYRATMIWWMALEGQCLYAIHGLSGDDYLQYLGQGASHGCIRLARETAKYLYDRVSIGTRVFVR